MSIHVLIVPLTTTSFLIPTWQWLPIFHRRKQKPIEEPTSPTWPSPSQTLNPLISYSVTTSLAHPYCFPDPPRQAVHLQAPQHFCLHLSSSRYLCIPSLCPLHAFPHTHPLSGVLSISCKVGIPQPPKLSWPSYLTLLSAELLLPSNLLSILHLLLCFFCLSTVS